MSFKNVIITLLLVGLFAISFYSCKPKTAATQPENVSYFRSLLFSETPWDTESGVHPITAEEAKTINNYKLTYDENKRLVRSNTTATAFCLITLRWALPKLLTNTKTASR